MVTHDRDLIEGFANRIFAFGPKGLTDFKGDYGAYLAQQEATAKSEKKSRR
ncbi:hypothetical protein D3C83_154080 [compost metagenome]